MLKILKLFQLCCRIRDVAGRASTHIVKTQRELRALVSPGRQEIVDVLSRMGPASIAELAAVLGRPADGLYYHVRALTGAGLISHAGVRVRKGRREAVFSTAGRELKLEYRPRDRENARAVTAIVASMLRLGTRDFRRAFNSTHVAVSGAHRDLWALRSTGWLSKRQLAGVNRSMAHLARALSNPKGKGRLYALTIVLTPLDRRRRTSGRR
jgi:predicted transcriptional regulator